jgi:hypothetical protein
MATLLDLISNHLVLAQLAPYLSTSALFHLAITSRSFSEALRGDPKAFQRLDLSTVRGVPFELCEDEAPEEHVLFDKHSDGPWARYCLPLMKLASTSWKWDILPRVQTLILDRQYIHSDTLRDILLDGACQIRLLSLLGVWGLDRIEFQSLIDDIFRGGRRGDGPRLEGIYYFGAPLVSKKFQEQVDDESTLATAAKESGSPSTDDDLNTWYRHSQVAFQAPRIEFDSALLRVTQGVVVWDAVLCRAPRHTYPHDRFIVPAIASVALGPTGCHICHSSPEGPGRTVNQLPLLSPPPLHSSSIKVAQEIPSDKKYIAPLPFYARCVNCLKNRWCACCNKWWCEDCYQAGGPNCYVLNNITGPSSAGSKVRSYPLLAIDNV